MVPWPQSSHPKWHVDRLIPFCRMKKSLDAWKDRKVLRVSGTAKKTNERVLNKSGVKRELLDTVKARKLAYYGHTTRKQGSCLGKEIGPNARNNARCTQARKATHGLDGQHQDVDRTPRGRVNQNDRGQINWESTSMVWPTLGSRTANRTGQGYKVNFRPTHHWQLQKNTILYGIIVSCLGICYVEYSWTSLYRSIGDQ